MVFNLKLLLGLPLLAGFTEALPQQAPADGQHSKRATSVKARSINGSLTDDYTELFEYASDLSCRCASPEFLNYPHFNITPPEQAEQCADYKLIDARGTGEPQGMSLMFYNMIQHTLDAVPGGVSQPVPYPAAPTQNITSGTMWLAETLRQGVQDCPNQRYGLFGYSQGAVLTLTVLAELAENPTVMDAIQSLVLVGNPFHMPGKLSNVDPHGNRNPSDTSIGIAAAPRPGAGASTDAANSGPRIPTALDQSGKAIDYCLDDDNICAINPRCDCTGTIYTLGHVSYVGTESVQTSAIQHLIRQFTNNASSS
ncbi:hypothetical protein KC360_g5199 [Hortaea werneckii]|nr:hypothetical protein KC325_g5318 [Hortaea werneckii]KAI6995315.1 hypothetical protein KC359_g4138 [Hortaea werneckii]KAI7144481.1 hypothetical protein KC344_g5328 [Hortaea werneckii]KAI7172938.1 hypothetical protein KC360_g5199 [Hortaea werneckii]